MEQTLVKHSRYASNPEQTASSCARITGERNEFHRVDNTLNESRIHI